MQKFVCPVCGAAMVRRSGKKITFSGCSNYFKTGCIGKRSLEGEVWGCEEEEPYYLNEEGSSMFSTCIADGFDYEEAAEIAADWQRWEEKDHWK